MHTTRTILCFWLRRLWFFWHQVSLPLHEIGDLTVQLIGNKAINSSIVDVNVIKWLLLPKVMLLLWEVVLHVLVGVVDENGCHHTHSSPVTAFILEQILQINMELIWNFNGPGSPHRSLVTPFVDASKFDI